MRVTTPHFVIGHATAIAVAVLAFVLVATGPRPAPAGVFNPETFTLDNGLRVVVVTNRRVPVVTHMVWYGVGAADEPYGKSGIAHFLEHLMFKGTDEIEPGEFSRIVARNGGSDNAFTSQDFTAYFQNVARDRLDLVMRMEADRMTDLRLAEEDVVTERDVILEERRQRTDNRPRGLWSEAVGAALFVNHPYGTPVIGWADEISALDRADALAFYRRFYVPNNAVLVVSGDIDAAELRPLAETYYGSIPRGPEIVRRRPPEPPIRADRRVVLEDAEVFQPSLQRRFIAPSANQGDSAHVYALDVLADILGGGATSRLHRTLVLEDRVARGVSVYYQGTSLDYGSFSIAASPSSTATVEALEASLDRELARLIDAGVTVVEVATSIRRMLAAAAYARDSLMRPAYVFGMALTTGQSVEDVEAWPDRLAAVTVEQVNAAARHVFTRSSVTGVLLPAQPVSAQGS